MPDRLLYLRFQSNPQNIASVLSAKSIPLDREGAIDLLTSDELQSFVYKDVQVSIKQYPSGFYLYRIRLPRNATRGDAFPVSTYGNSTTPPFMFQIEVQ